jgi:hypothetical protein
MRSRHRRSSRTMQLAHQLHVCTMPSYVACCLYDQDTLYMMCAGRIHKPKQHVNSRIMTTHRSSMVSVGLPSLLVRIRVLALSIVTLAGSVDLAVELAITRRSYA